MKLQLISLSAGLVATAYGSSQSTVTCHSSHVCSNVLQEQIENNEDPGERSGGTRNSPTGSSSGTATVLKGTIKTILNVDVDDLGDDANPGPRFGMKFRLPVINNYGCWCYGGEFWPGARDWTGYGPFMDEYDDACKAHHQGFDCISMDAKAEDKTCNPIKTVYSLLVSPQANGDYLLECDDSIEFDWCKRRVCMVDLRFIARHWHLEELGVEPDYAKYGHNGFHNNAGDFDTDVCIIPRTKGPGGHQHVQKVCCGDYPYRIWYDKKNIKGVRCCQYEDTSVNSAYGFSIRIGKLFNRMSATCCSYGVVTDGNQC